VRVIGCMSGTSYDAVDAAVVDLELSGDEVHATLLGWVSVPVPDDLRHRIGAALPPAGTTLEEVCRLDTEIGQLVGDVAAQARDEHGGWADLVVSHGQTVFHWVEGARARGTLQLGSAAWVAERVGLPVVSDLRTRDIARGGQGAPLVSLFDALFVLPGEAHRGALNLGGIANLTVAGSDGSALAWDIGPANALVDAVVQARTGGTESMDTGGLRGARGTVDEGLLASLLADPYYALPPPKSTGKELFHLDYVRGHLHGAVSDDDLVATLVELTAATVADAVRKHGVEEVVASGGGTHNPLLMARLRARCSSARVSTIDELGVPSQAKEAIAFALMGFFTVHGLAGTAAGATGAWATSVLGSITPGAAPLRLPEPATIEPRRLVLLPTS
jgi:anhydro-N-acetylmuramic acid kinase